MRNIAASGVPESRAEKVECESPPNKITSPRFAIFCISRKRAWFPTFDQRENGRKNEKKFIQTSPPFPRKSLSEKTILPLTVRFF